MVDYKVRKLILLIVLTVFIFADLVAAIYFSFSQSLPQSLHSASDDKSSTIQIRIHGSDSIGEKLIPELIRHYLDDGLNLAFQETNIPPLTGNITSDYDRMFTFTKEGQSHTIQVKCMTSGAGVEDLINNRCDIAMSSAQDVQVEHPDIVSYMIAGDALCFVANNQLDNCVNDLSVEDIRNMYSCLSYWSSYSGPNIKVTPFITPDGTGTRKMFEQVVLENVDSAYFSKNINIEDTNQGALEKVSKTPGAIGFISISALNRLAYYPTLTKLKIRGIDPSINNVKNENYPFTRRLFLCTNPKDKQNSFTKSFLEYVVSARGQEVVASIGFADRNINIVEQHDSTDDAIPAYRSIARNGWQLSIIRFPSNRSTEADIKGREDILAIAKTLYSKRKEIKTVYVFGFTDLEKSVDTNTRLSDKRAVSIVTEVEKAWRELYNEPHRFELTPIGCGATSPIIPNAKTDIEREKNRRVEVWVSFK